MVNGPLDPEAAEAVSSPRSSSVCPPASRWPAPRPQRLNLGLVVAGSDVLDPPRPAPGGPHDLHPGGPRRRPHGAHVGHQPTLRPPISAQVRAPHLKNPQVQPLRDSKIAKSDKSQD